jgi:hypothetical protein
MDNIILLAEWASTLVGHDNYRNADVQNNDVSMPLSSSGTVSHECKNPNVEVEHVQQLSSSRPEEVWATACLVPKLD